MDGEPPPPVALVARHARADRRPQLARELLGELPGGVQALPRPGMQRVDVDPLEQLIAAGDRQYRRPQISLEAASELGDQPDRVEREHRHQLPAVTRPERRHDEHANRPLHGADAAEPFAGERQPAVRADSPAPQVRGVELIGVGEHPPRQVVHTIALESERARERAPLVELIRPHPRIFERDRQPSVGAPQPLVQSARRDGDPVPIEAGFAIGQRLPIDQRGDRRRRQPAGAHRPLPVPVQYRLAVRVAAAPHLRVVGVERLVARQPPKRQRGELLQCPAPAREAPKQLPGRLCYTRARLKSLAFERAIVGRGGPTARPRARIRCRRRHAGGGDCVRHASLLVRRFDGAHPREAVQVPRSGGARWKWAPVSGGELARRPRLRRLR